MQIADTASGTSVRTRDGGRNGFASTFFTYASRSSGGSFPGAFCTGTPVSNGLKEREVEDLISKFMQNRKVCCFEIAEVNPTLDKENLMAEIAFNILQRSVNILMMN